jgi:DNA-binding Xre family transcriptional regulator
MKRNLPTRRKRTSYEIFLHKTKYFDILAISFWRFYERRRMDFKLLGARLLAARRRQGLKQKELAAKVGIHPVTLSRIEHGTMSGVTLQVIATLADVLGISVDHLLGRKDSDAVEPQPAGVAVGWSPKTTPAEECCCGDSSIEIVA